MASASSNGVVTGILRLGILAAIALFMSTSFRTGWTEMATDFPNYYTAAVLVRQGKPLRDYYDWTWFARQMNYAGIEKQLGAYTPQTPLTMLPVVGLAALPSMEAKRVVLVLDLVFLAAIVLILARLTAIRWEYIAILLLAGHGSLHANIVDGQYYIFLLLLLTLTFWSFDRGQFAASGLITGLACGLKLYAGPLFFLFAVKKKWSGVAGMLAAAALLSGLAIAIFGWSDILYYLARVLPRTLEGGSTDPYNPGGSTISTLLRHLLVSEPELNPHPAFAAPWLYFFANSTFHFGLLAFTVIGIASTSSLTAGIDGKPSGAGFSLRGTSVPRGRLADSSSPQAEVRPTRTSPHSHSTRRSDDRRDFAVLVILSLLLSTSVASYTLILLLAPILLLLHNASPLKSAALVVIYLLLNNNLGLTWLFPKVWLLVLLFALAAADYWSSIRIPAAICAAVAVLLVAALDAGRHMRDYTQEPGRRYPRIAAQPGALFSGYPVITNAGLFYQAMGDHRKGEDGYLLAWVHNNRIEKFGFSGYALRPFAPSPEGPIRFELVANRTSRTMQFDPVTRTAAPIPAPVGSMTRNESAVSPDGRWIAYARDTSFSQQLWIKDIVSGRSRMLTGGACNTNSPAWELDSSALVFASDCGRAFGLPALYRAPVLSWANSLEP
jgi:hypothetical protein